MVNNKSIIIIGAGLAGLSTGCYAQMSGFDSKILEMHYIPGGCCTAWRRGEYVFDWCISWMIGSGSGNELNQMWHELGALQGKKIKNFEIFNYVKDTDGRIVKFYSDPNKLEAHLKQLSPQDKEQIEEFCKGVRKFKKLVHAYPFLKPVPLMGFMERAKMMLKFFPHFRLLKRSMNTKMSDFANGFRDPLLRKAFNYIFFEKHVNFPLLPFYFNLGCAANVNTGVPEGASYGVAKSMESRYLSLGGNIHYRSKIEKIIVKDNKAVGVRLKDGSEHYADIIISACDGRTVVLNMLEGKYTDEAFNKLYKELADMPGMIREAYVTIFLGVDMDLSKEPHYTTYLLNEEEAESFPSSFYGSVHVQIRSICSPGFAPEGKSVIQISYFADFDYWKNLYADKKKYRQEKNKVLESAIRVLEKSYPGIGAKIEQTDVATPMTQLRYTGNHKGTVLAWDPFNEAIEVVEELGNKYGMKLPGLQNFYMTGHWTTWGGLIKAAASGRQVMQFVCKDNNAKFNASVQEGLLKTELYPS